MYMSRGLSQKPIRVIWSAIWPTAEYRLWTNQWADSSSGLSLEFVYLLSSHVDLHKEIHVTTHACVLRPISPPQKSINSGADLALGQSVMA